MSSTCRLHRYALSIGSNRPLSACRTPARLLTEAIASMRRLGQVIAASPTIVTSPLGPSRRRFANAALLLDTPLPPPALLDALQAVERQLGRKRFRRWGARSIDIDIILWSGGRWRSRTLTIPHPAFARRDFVLTPLREVAPLWRDPRSGLTIRHLHARLAKARARG